VLRNDWWDIRQLRTRPYYVLSMMHEQSSGSYRNENGFQCRLSYGDFFFCFPHFRQTFSPGQNEYWQESYIGFVGEVFDCCRESGVLCPQRPVWHLDDPAPWLERLHTLLRAPRPTTPRGVRREATDFLAFVLQMLEYATPVAHSDASNDWFERACVLLTNDLSRKLALREVAAELEMSYGAFRLHFTRRAGMPPARYRDRQRIQVACDFLRSSNKPCHIIAANLGYCSEQYFSTLFKAATGLAPREYRRRHQAP
jgi:AraC-like DNA-binding protein